MMKLKTTLILLTLLISTSLVAQDLFVRSAVIPIPVADQNLGIGNVLAGVDFDGDGKTEMYFVNDMWDQAGEVYTPRMYKYELNGTSWDSVWSAALPRTQNTWPGLAQADLDGDGKPEVIWTPAEGSRTPSPARIYVFEAPGDGSDNMGVDDGAGGWKANTEWNFDLPDGASMRAIKIVVADFDGDGKQEVALADRKSYFSMAIVSVSDVPDDANGSETWTLEFNGKDVQANEFIRNGEIASPDGGFGNAVAGMDYDGDGLIEMYAVNNNWVDGAGGELIPTLFKYEYVAGAWIKKWETIVNYIPAQNTWPILLAGDWDNDGKGEIIWTPINNLDATTNPNPDRILVYEFPGDSTSDAMGIDNGDGTWNPNAAWNFDVPDMTEMRPFGAVLTDVDSDGTDEFVFAERKEYYGWGVVSVSDIPDLGDGSETWTMEANGTSDNSGSNYRDVLVDENIIYVFDWNGDIQSIEATGSSYDSLKTQNIGSSWVFRGANVTDLDNDGITEFIVNDYGGSGSKSIWVLQKDADSLVATAIVDFSANTASRITTVRVGNIDSDSLAEFIVGFRQTDEVYKVDYLGGDITDPANYTTSLLDKGIIGEDGKGQIDIIVLANIDGDDADEVMYAGPPRSFDANALDMGSGDFGDWSIGSSNWDVVTVNTEDAVVAVSMNLSGDIYPVFYHPDSSKYKFGHFQSGIIGGNGNFLSASSGDVDGDGNDEIFMGEYWGSAKVYMLMVNENGAAEAHMIADLSLLGATRLTGGAAGDIDGDGNIDLVFGTRDGSPWNSVYRVKYMGGDPTDINSWGSELIDSGILASGGQIDIVQLANVDNDADLEVIYSGVPRGDGYLPIVVLDLQKVSAEAIAGVKIDSDGDGVPDRLGEQVVTMGIVTSLNFSSSGYLTTIQDESAAIHLWSSGDTLSNYNIGDRVQVSGEVAQFRGLTEIYTTPEDILFLGTATTPEPMVVTIADLQADPEKYESMLLKINAITLSGGTWPAEGSNANLDMTDGYLETRVRIDKDLDLDGQPEPVWPVNVIVVGAQYSSSSSVVNDGYQYFPRMYSDFEQNVAAPPSPYFFFTEETAALDGGEYEITNVDEDYSLVWHPAVDLNGEALIYQVVGINEGNEILLTSSDNNAVDTVYSQTGQDVIDIILANSSDNMLEISYTIRTVSSNPAEGIISSVDTITVTFKDMVTDINDRNIIPKEFFVDQNYPNPFNPTTTIKFGLPVQAEVNLIIYDILGREVTRLVNSKVMSAGVYQYSFDAGRLASGTYIYRLQADKKVEVKKMLLLK
ncbi:MAG: FG-GAP-like repeat-containing protein [Melioribacteraceae bacterium]|nr:FG-GAP-like repeat-containing protein [Melioribacteraceae bacterium]